MLCTWSFVSRPKTLLCSKRNHWIILCFKNFGYSLWWTLQQYRLMMNIISSSCFTIQPMHIHVFPFRKWAWPVKQREKVYLTKIYINIKLVFALLKGLHHPILIIVSVDFDTLIIIKNSYEPYELLIQWSIKQSSWEYHSLYRSLKATLSNYDFTLIQTSRRLNEFKLGQ